MPTWIFYAILSMIFAGVTSVIAKLGLAGISADVGLTVRTGFVFAFVTAFAIATVPPTQLQQLNRQNFLWLAISALTTTLSWVYYYRAIKLGDVSTVAQIDKGSFVVAVILAWVILGEQITLRTVIGGLLIVSGLLVVVRR